MPKFRLLLLGLGLMTAGCDSRAQDTGNGVPSPAAESPKLAKDALNLVQTIPLPGVEGRFDHMAIDVRRRRLFIAALGNDTLEVIDLRAGKVIKSIKGSREPTGVAFSSDLDRVFAANGAGESCEILDGAKLTALRSVKPLPDADNVRYDGVSKHVYVGYGDGALAIIDAATGNMAGNVPLDGHPESFQLEQAGPRIFVNIPSAEQIAVVNRVKRIVIAKWPMEGARSNFPMALDEANHRLFIGCRAPARVLVYDTNTSKVVSQLPIDGDTDDLFWDAARKRLYVSCGAGFLDVIQEKVANNFESTARIPTAAGARTSLFAPELDRLYLAVPHRGAQGAEIRVYSLQR